jgi:magnesium-transporting ATPase (P-type)
MMAETEADMMSWMNRLKASAGVESHPLRTSSEVLVRKHEIVFARTSPKQKLTIVKEFAKAGNVTAMTGDG